MILYIFFAKKNEESIQVDMRMFSHLQKFMEMFHNSFVIEFTYIINMNIVVCCSIFFWIGRGMGANYISYTIGMFKRNSFGIIRIFCCLNHCYMIYWLINIRRSVDLTRKGVLIEKMYVIVNITIIHIDTNSSEQTYTAHYIFMCSVYYSP